LTRPKIRLLGLSGSLRRVSTNTALLQAAAAAAPENVDLHLFERLADLPIFNPDLEDGPLPEPVVGLRHAVSAADGLVFAVPEYAHGIPGGLKNALDWLVSGSEIPGKPVAFFHASPRSHHGRAALEEVLRTMSTIVVPEASVTVPLLGLSPEAMTGRLAEAETADALRQGLGTFVEIVRRCRRA
jgi:NAD(P)H-dependent FMN reductase